MLRAHTDEDIQWSLHGVRAHQAGWVLDFGDCFGFSSALFRDYGVLEFSGLHVEVPQNALLTFSLRDDTPIFHCTLLFYGNAGLTGTNGWLAGLRNAGGV